MLLNLDGGEHDDEPEELYALADLVHIACGGHAGDAVSMARVVDACQRHGTRVGAHPSYADREGFGRRAIDVDPALLTEQIASQCASLRAVADRAGATIVSVKPHGALYHAAHAEDAIAKACVSGAVGALGEAITIVGLANGALAAAAKEAGVPFLREAFADRGVKSDGVTLIPRGEPGALIDDPVAAAARARDIASSGAADTLCIHADTPSSLAIARAVREVLTRS